MRKILSSLPVPEETTYASPEAGWHVLRWDLIGISAGPPQVFIGHDRNAWLAPRWGRTKDGVPWIGWLWITLGFLWGYQDQKDLTSA